jgi:hypothetical protein
MLRWRQGSRGLELMNKASLSTRCLGFVISHSMYDTSSLVNQTPLCPCQTRFNNEISLVAFGAIISLPFRGTVTPTTSALGLAQEFNLLSIPCIPVVLHLL